MTTGYFVWVSLAAHVIAIGCRDTKRRSREPRLLDINGVRPTRGYSAPETRTDAGLECPSAALQDASERDLGNITFPLLYTNTKSCFYVDLVEVDYESEVNIVLMGLI